MLINCRMWTTSPQTQILLKASLSCTSLEDNEAVIKMLIKERRPTMRQRVQNQQSCAWLVVRQDQFGPHKSESNMLTPKNQLADMVTKRRTSHVMSGSIYLRLLNSNGFLWCFPAAISATFLSDPIGKQSAMSKRGQEATSSGGSPMAKPKPMVPAKERPVYLVLRSPYATIHLGPNYLANLEVHKNTNIEKIQS